MQNSNKIINDKDTLLIIEDPIIKSNTLNQLKPEFFNYYKNITIDKGKVVGSHSNFPVLISIFDIDLHDHTQASGNDIVFFSNSQWLDYEIELYNKIYNGTHAQLIVWIRLPLISDIEDTIISMFFGNSTMESEQNPEGVWYENYIMVHHLNGSSYSELDDSTSNNNDVSSQYDSPHYNIEGKIGNAVEFDGDAGTDGLVVDDSNSLDITSNITLSAWVKCDSITQHNKIISKNNLQNEPWNSYSMTFDRDNNYFRMEMTGDGSQRTVERPIPATVSTWYYISVSYDQTSMRITVNGENEYINNIGSMTIPTSSLPLTIGREYYDKEYFDGIIDEPRISNIARSHDWSLTEYANQNDPSSFYSIGESIRLDFNAPTVIIDPSLPSGPYGQNQTYKEVVINATITDAESQVLKAITMIEADEPFNITMNLIAGTWTCKWDNISDYSNRDYMIRIWAVDEAGNINPNEFFVVTINNLPYTPDGDGGEGDNGGEGELGGDNGLFMIIIIILAVIGSVASIGTYGLIKMKNRNKTVSSLDDKILKISGDIRDTNTFLKEATSSFKELTPPPKIKTMERKHISKVDKRKYELTPLPKLNSIERKDIKRLDKKKNELTPLPKLNETGKDSKFLLQDEILKKELKKKTADEKLDLLRKIGQDKDTLD
ncbi:MAG: LamG-like jellyroll fold domain-containing protein [Promethearchaeota archaeon]